MGMPITVEIVESSHASNGRAKIQSAIDKVFEYFRYVDGKYSVYKESSEITDINRGRTSIVKASAEIKEIFKLAEKTKQETGGYFDIVNRQGIYDPSGIVKGWAILNAANLLKGLGFTDYCVEAGGDIQTAGSNSKGQKWRIGIKNPFKQSEIIKVIQLGGEGVATSGTYIRGQHIYNPKNMAEAIEDIVSLTVIGPNVYEADRFATAAFAMGKKGIEFIERQEGLEGYIIDKKGIATMTSGFERYVVRSGSPGHSYFGLRALALF